MKHLLFIILFIPAMLSAQKDSKYLAGAVPEVNGKVVYTKVISAPDLSKEQIFQTALAWSENRFKSDSKENLSRVLYTNAENGDIACMGEEFLTFQKTALSLDRAIVNYRVTIECLPGKCIVEISSIRYEYNVSYQKEPEKYIAEEWITDKYALSKNKDKLARGTGKFRSKTIDLVDNIFNDIQSALGGTTASAPVAAAQTAAPASALAVSTVNKAEAPKVQATQGTTSADLAGYKKITPDKIPGNIIKMLTEDWMLITAGNNQEFNMMTAGWGGLGSMFGKPVAFCFIAPTRYTYKLMEKNDTYTLTFYTEAYREALNTCGSKSGKDTDKVKASGLTPISTPEGSKAFAEAWLIIECRKMVSQSIIPEAITNQKLKEEWEGKQLHKMFIGEIINVWIK